jgi:hypothetical protein
MKYDEVTSIMEYLTNNLSESFRLTEGTEYAADLQENGTDNEPEPDEIE